MFNLEINGIGQSGGGTFGEVCVEGIGRLTGPIKCQNFNVSGMGFSKAVECEQNLIVEGTLKSASLKAANIHVSGLCRVQGEVKTLDLNVFGYLKVNQSLKVERAVIEGKVNLKEALEAVSLELTFVDDSVFDVITATNIVIKRSLDSEVLSHKNWLPFKKRTGMLVGDLIEGEDIYLEYLQVKQVYGDRVKIGPGCLIDEVEYKEVLEVDPTSCVKVMRQV